MNNLEERLKEIDEFFSKLTVEEFEEMVIKAGINLKDEKNIEVVKQ